MPYLNRRNVKPTTNGSAASSYVHKTPLFISNNVSSASYVLQKQKARVQHRVRLPCKQANYSGSKFKGYCRD